MWLKNAIFFLCSVPFKQLILGLSLFRLFESFKRFNEYCARVICHLGAFLNRLLQNNNVKSSNSAHFGELEPQWLIIRISIWNRMLRMYI